MVTEEKLEVLNQQFQRIFTLPVTRLTFRELQNSILTALNEDSNAMQTITESLLTNKFPDNPILEPFFKEYSVPFRVAKQIQDNGEMLTMISTDIGTQAANLLFQVSIRRLDGGEFKFMTDSTSFLQIAEHIVSRLASTSSTMAGKGAISSQRARLEALRESIDKLLG